MSGPITRQAYEELIDEDIAALPDDMPSLERSHIIAVLRDSVIRLYDDAPKLDSLRRENEQLGNELSERGHRLAETESRLNSVRDTLDLYEHAKYTSHGFSPEEALVQIQAALDNDGTAVEGQGPTLGGFSEANVRRLQQFFEKYALGSKERPSCLVCGKVPDEWPPAIQHAELPDIIVCTPCRDAGQAVAVQDHSLHEARPGASVGSAPGSTQPTDHVVEINGTDE